MTITTNNWMTMPHVTREVTEFGMTRLDDYGQDDLTAFVCDPGTETDDRLDFTLDALLGEGERYAAASMKYEGGVLALLDAEEPAMISSRPDAIPMHEPDYYENGMAWWVGESATVACPMEMVRTAGVAAVRGGWHARQGNYPVVLGFVVHPHGELPRLVSLSKHAEQYALWRAVQDAVLVEEQAVVL